MTFLGHIARLFCLLALELTCDHVAQKLLGLETTLDRTFIAILARSTVIQKETSFFTYKSIALSITTL
jgi:hypothetical protein